MTSKSDFSAGVRAVAAREGRYDAQAYFFVFEALEFTLSRVGERRHITGRELVEGIRDFSLANFGAMGRVVFNQWGITQTEDFGRIVFSLVEADLMSKTESDTMEDFREGFDFRETFESAYTPRGISGGEGQSGGKSPKNS